MTKKRYDFAARRCKYCRRPMSVSASSYTQNPYCPACFSEQLVKAAVEDPVVGWTDLPGGYVRPIRLSDLTKRS